MKKFVNRDKELKFLESEYKKGESSLVVVYGRRRVGKTSLINEFCKDKRSLYFLATEEGDRQNLLSFQTLVADFTNNELLQQATFDNWNAVFSILSEYTTDKIVITIDEFQYLGKSNVAFPSIFQKVWDTILRDKNVMVILCGSYLSMMESQTLDYNSPLYGRRTGQIKLKPIGFKDYHEFFAETLSHKELIDLYAVTGGVPKYIEVFNQGENVFQSISDNILNKSSFLYDETNFLLHREVKEVGTYFSIIRTIAEGNRKLAQIAGKLSVAQSSLSKYLSTLIKLDILEREVPITEVNPQKSKKGLYKVKDNYILFWFLFIYPNLNFIESDNSGIVANKIAANFYDRHAAFVYEDICIQKMWELSSANCFAFHFDKVGRWWDKSNEIDVVAIDSESGNMIFGECKYIKGRVGLNILQKLEEKAKQVKYSKRGVACFVLFAVNGFTDELIELEKSRSDLVLSR